MRIFLVAAIVASASATGTFIGTITTTTWFEAAFLAYLVDCLFGGWITTAWGNRRVVTTQAQVVQ